MKLSLDDDAERIRFDLQSTPVADWRNFTTTDADKPSFWRKPTREKCIKSSPKQR